MLLQQTLIAAPIRGKRRSGSERTFTTKHRTDMPRFFIDTYDGHFWAEDEGGAEFRDLEAARLEAISALPEIALDRDVTDGPREWTASVRDEAGQVLLRATLKLSVDWAAAPPNA